MARAITNENEIHNNIRWQGVYKYSLRGRWVDNAFLPQLPERVLMGPGYALWLGAKTEMQAGLRTRRVDASRIWLFTSTVGSVNLFFFLFLSPTSGPKTPGPYNQGRPAIASNLLQEARKTVEWEIWWCRGRLWLDKIRYWCGDRSREPRQLADFVIC